ncbi:ABC transporter permease [bacterium]|nr:ABC transporter permease [bacterium]
MSSSLEVQSPVAAKSTRNFFARLWYSRELIFTLVKRDLKIRYKSSALGFLWSFGRPLLLMLVIWGVFSLVVRLIPSSHPMLPYSLHILTALLPWMFLSTAIAEALFTILGNANVVKKVWLPTEVFPAAVVVGQLVHFALTLLVLAGFVIVYAIFGKIPEGQPGAGGHLGVLMLPGWEIIFLPFLVVLQALFALGLALIVSSLNVFYRDVSSIVEIVLSAWFYLTPIIYPGNLARPALKGMGLEPLYWIWLSNPMTPITLAYRRIFFGRLFRHAPEVSDSTLFIGLGVTTLATMLILWAGIALFRKQSLRFADEL